jgi:hypothetical protein
MSMHANPHAFALSGELVGHPLLTSLEWKVVSLALREAETAGCGGLASPPSRVRRMFRKMGSALFGWNYSNPLADRRLELLRRFVCALRKDLKRAERLAVKLVELGFSQAQLTSVKLMAGA